MMFLFHLKRTCFCFTWSVHDVFVSFGAYMMFLLLDVFVSLGAYMMFLLNVKRT